MKKALLFILAVVALFASSCKKQTLSSPNGLDEVAERGCFYFEAAEQAVDFYMTASDGTLSTPNFNLEYSVNVPDWKPFKVGETVVKLTNIGDKVYLRAKGTNNRVNTSNGYFKFVSTKRIKVGGNIMFLLDSTGTRTLLNNTENTAAFSYLFCDMKNLTDASKLVLPAIMLSDACYAGMFMNCVSLNATPELPAKSLATNCYSYMFAGCTSLTTAPELPAQILAQGCYASMFYGCESLLSGPTLSSMNLATSCYSQMFAKCTSLTSAPELPAETLVDNCYNYMFAECTSLLSAPALPAEELVYMCYSGMFSGCEMLDAVDVDFTSWNSNATASWLDGVAEHGVFRCPEDLDTTRHGVSYIPVGWKSFIKY